MVVASGQFPYRYDITLPIRGNIGQSGNILEAGMFVIYAEFRKFGIEPLDFFTFNKYSHPNIAASGFEPKGNGATLAGNVGGPAIVALDNILEMRSALHDIPNGLWYSAYGSECHLGQGTTRNYVTSSLFTTSYPGIHPSGEFAVVDFGGGSYGADDPTFLRPELTTITGGNDHLDTDLHWLGGSGILFDIDIGEVVFQPPTFFGGLNTIYANSTFIPSFQKTDGSLITLTGRETNDAPYSEYNFNAVNSGKVQIDGYGFLPQTKVNLITGNESNFYSTVGANSDFTFHSSGARQLNGSAGLTDHTARTYWTPQTQSSGFYSAIAINPKTPLVQIPSGIISIWPEISKFIGFNFELGRSISITSDNKVKKTSLSSNGYQVFDDAVWMTSPSVKLGITASNISRGIHVLSPHNGKIVWYRPADNAVATTGNMPIASSEYDTGTTAGTPGAFETHYGLERYSGNYIRVSRVWNETITDLGAGFFDVENTVYFQRYSAPAMNHTETLSYWMHSNSVANETGEIGNIISDLFYDGTYYWLTSKNGRKHRFTNALVFDGTYVGAGNNTGRNTYIDGEYLYWYSGGGLTIGDPLLSDANMTNRGIGSGIGKWSIVSDPADIYADRGQVSNDSAKPIIAETFVGVARDTDTRIHDIIEVTSAQATHVTPGIWALITFASPTGFQRLWLLRIVEETNYYRTEEAIFFGIEATQNSEYPRDIIFGDID